MRSWTLFASVFLLAPAPALACGKPELRAFVEAAQSLADKAATLGPKLLTCPSETAEAAQWLAFFRALKTPPPRLGTLPKAATAKTGVPGEVGRAIAQAYGGAVAGVRGPLDAGDPRYKETPEAALAVGRMLVRERRFADGRRYYEDFLRERDDAPAEEAEYLYTWIWQGDLERADQELATVRLEGKPTELAAAVQRARALVAKLRGTPGKATGKDAAPVKPRGEPMLEADAEAHALVDQLRRYSSRVSYQGIVDARWEHHLLATQVYEQASLNTDELWLGRTQPITEQLAAAAHAGYVTHARVHWAADATLRFRQAGGVEGELGAERRHLFKSVPLAKPSFGLYQQSAYLELGWDRRFRGRSTLLEDEGGVRFARHELGLRQPLGKAAPGEDVVSVLADAGYEARPQPSAEYESYRKTQKLAIGAGWERRGGSVEALTELRYVLRARQPFGDTVYLRHSGADLRVELARALGESLWLAGTLAYAAEETDRPRSPSEHRVTLGIGVRHFR